jgi:predicted amidohydrolase YtcJ
LKADLIFMNGKVITVNEKNDVVEAVAVKGNRIIATGSNEDIKNLQSTETKVINLDGKSLLPGFIDAHCHITLHGTSKSAISCKQGNVNSIQDVLNLIRERAKSTPEKEWIRVVGFNETKVAEKRYPTRWELDEISTAHPIIVTRACGHISVVNSVGLELAGFDEKTADPKGGKIVRNEEGVPTGVLIEEANMIMSFIATYSEDEMTRALKIASQDYTEAGITSIHDAGGYSTLNFRVLQKSVQSGIVKQRVYAMLCTVFDAKASLKNLMESGIVTGLGDERYKIGPAKLFIDGSSSGPTVATRKPYTSDSNDYGVLYLGQEELDDALIPAHAKGFQITAHAQGDRAIEMLLNTIEKAVEKYPRTDHRHRVEHAGIATPDLIDRMKKLGVIPIPNPPFPYEYGDIYKESYGDRVNHMYPLRDYIDKGVIAAGGSDNPVADFNPLLGIHVAVNRQTQFGQDIGVNQKVSALEAIGVYTLNGAYASFEEDIKGSIEIGKLADFVILNDDILEIPPNQIKEMKAIMTVIDGEIIYERSVVAPTV